MSFDTRETAIEEHFETYGKIVDVRLAYSRDGVSKGFGYVEFKYIKDSEDALQSLSGQHLDGRALKLDFDHDHDQRGEDRRRSSRQRSYQDSYARDHRDYRRNR